MCHYGAYLCSDRGGGGEDRMPNPLSPGVASPEGFLPGARPPHRRAGAPAGRAGDRYGAWVSELGPVAQEMGIRPATIEDAGEVVRLATLMYEAMGLDATGMAWRRAAVTAMARRPGEPRRHRGLHPVGFHRSALAAPGPGAPDHLDADRVVPGPGRPGDRVARDAGGGGPVPLARLRPWRQPRLADPPVTATTDAQVRLPAW